MTAVRASGSARGCAAAELPARSTPAAGTRLHFIGAEGVLFSQPRQELHAFNTTSCVIWCHLEDGLSPPEIAGELATGSGLDEATARTHVGAALADWLAKGLLAESPPLPLAAPPPDAIRALPPPPEAGFAAVRRYRMLGVTVRLRCVEARHARLIDPLLAHLAYAGGDPADITVVIAPLGDSDGSGTADPTPPPRGPAGERAIEADRAAGGIGLWRDGVAAGSCARLDELAPVAKAVVWTAVLRRQAFLLHVHAGVVGGPAGCVLLPAAAGSGKSTLTTGLVHAGFDLFSDEVALLAPDLTVTPFPTSICVKDSGIETIARMYPRVRDLPIHRRGDGKRAAYLPPPPGAVPPDGHHRAVCGLVFPRFRAGAAMRSRVVPPAEALARFLGQCLNVGPALDHVIVERLVRWIEPMPCAAIEYGSLEPACAMVGAMLRGDDRAL